MQPTGRASLIFFGIFWSRGGAVTAVTSIFVRDVVRHSELHEFYNCKLCSVSLSRELFVKIPALPLAAAYHNFCHCTRFMTTGKDWKICRFENCTLCSVWKLSFNDHGTRKFTQYHICFFNPRVYFSVPRPSAGYGYFLADCTDLNFKKDTMPWF